MKSIPPESMPAYYEMCKRWEQHTLGTLPNGPTRDEIDLAARSRIPPLQIRIDSIAHVISNEKRRERRIYSIVYAHVFSISRLFRIREEINAEKRREKPCNKFIRAMLAEEFAETEALAQSYDALLAFCDGDEAELWHQIRRFNKLESSLNVFNF